MDCKINEKESLQWVVQLLLSNNGTSNGQGSGMMEQVRILNKSTLLSDDKEWITLVFDVMNDVKSNVGVGRKFVFEHGSITQMKPDTTQPLCKAQWLSSTESKVHDPWKSYKFTRLPQNGIDNPIHSGNFRHLHEGLSSKESVSVCTNDSDEEWKNLTVVVKPFAEESTNYRAINTAYSENVLSYSV
jgi:hypothetical protein